MSDCIVPSNMCMDKDGYPVLKFNKKVWKMSRFLWTKVFGNIENGMVVAHKCNNKSCINVNHLYLATSKQNSTDAAKDGLYLSGDNHPKTIRSDESCLKMYEMYHEHGDTQQKIGNVFGISQSRVSECIRRASKILGDNR